MHITFFLTFDTRAKYLPWLNVVKPCPCGVFAFPQTGVLCG